jgi:hypothetical protein
VSAVGPRARRWCTRPPAGLSANPLQAGNLAMFEPEPADSEPIGVADRLLKSSRRFAQRAIEAYVTETWDAFYLHLSTAVEQLVKSVLASVHPALIADKAADFETLLHLTGNPQFAVTPESAARTVSVTEAIRRVGRLLPDFRQATPRVTYLLDMRNGIVHAGHTARAEHQAVLGEVATFVDQLLVHQNVVPAEFWGPHADLVAEHGRRRIDALEAAFQRSVRNARDRHERFFASLNDDEQVAFLEAREPEELADEYDSARATCPSCGNLGLLTGQPEPQWQADWDAEGGEAYLAGAYVASVRLFATGFHCEVCSLTIHTDSLAFAGFAAVELTEEDADLEEATAFFTRQLAEDQLDDDNGR